MTQVEQQRTTETSGKVIYTAKTHTTGGRENGVSRSSDGQLEIKLSLPGSPRPGTNPEQLFAAGWSACSRGHSCSRPKGRRSSFRPMWRSMLKSIFIWSTASISSVPASMFQFPELNGASRKTWSRMRS